MSLLKAKFNRHGLFVIFYLAYILFSLFIYKDYGLSWDERGLRYLNGYFNYDYVEHGDYEKLLEGNEKYHGAAFELMLIYFEKGLGLQDEVPIIYMRHLVNFFFFALGILFFYLIIIRKFNSPWLGVIGCLLLLLTPRIFADSYYNSKDMSLLIFTVISIYTGLLFFTSRSPWVVVAHACSTALVVDMRIVGVIIPLFTIAYAIIRFSLSRQYKQILWKIPLYLLLLAPLIIFFWPVMWRNPVDNFIAAFREMSNYHWFGFNLYKGAMVPGNDLPWHYLPVWIGITMPFLQLLLFFAGIFFFFRAIVRRLQANWKSIFEMDYEWINVFLVFAPILSVIIMRSVVYDGWRHLYFICPSMILIGIIGVNKLREIFARSRKAWLFHLLLYLPMSGIAMEMMQLHPYEMVYFNRLGGSSLKKIKPNYELDYWGLSSIEVLRHLTEHDRSDSIRIYAAENPGEDSQYMLDSMSRKRLFYFEQIEKSDYIITSYRNHPQDYNLPNVFSVRRDGAGLASLYAVRPQAALFRERAREIFSAVNDYESPVEYWYGEEIIDKPSGDNSRCYEVLPGELYSSTFHITIDSTMAGGEPITLIASMEIFSEDTVPFKTVFQVDAVDGTTRYWEENKDTLFNSGSWRRIECMTTVNQIAQGETLKVFQMNTEKGRWLMDNFSVKFYRISVPNEND